jgi:hypothetical protein
MTRIISGATTNGACLASWFLVLSLLIRIGPETCFAQTAGDDDPLSEEAAAAFHALDLYIDSGREPLAAYQVEITYDRAAVRIVGLEGGDPPAYAKAPYFDRAGFRAGRIIVAAFTADDESAPKGRFRAARIHVAVDRGVEPRLDVTLTAAAKPGGERISPKVELRKHQKGLKAGEG